MTADTPTTPASIAPRRRQVRVVAATAILTCLATLIAVAAVSWPSSTEILRSEQPDAVSYQDGTVHYLVVQDRGLHWAGFTGLVDGTRHHRLVVGSDPSGRYGHMLDTDLPGPIEKAEVVWTAEDVRLTFPGGHQTVIPAAAFTGGR